MTELIVLLALLLVGKHFVGFGCFLELLLGLLIVRITVGVIFDGELAVRLFYFIGRCGLRHPKHLIIISFLLHIKL